MAINEKELSLVLKAYDKGLKTGLKNARTELDRLDKSAKKTSTTMKGVGTASANAAVGVAKLAAAYGGFRAAQAAVSTVVSFNTAMAEISTLTDASSASLDGLADDIVTLSTQLPQTAGELATATYDIISAGVALEDTTKVLELSAKAAVAGVTDTQTAVTAGVGVMNAYGQEVSDLDEIYDTLFQTVRLGVVKFEDLAQNIGKVTPIARSAGVNFTSLSAAVATLTKGGLSADIATTALRGAIVALSSATPEAKQKMEELGISWTGLEGTIKQIADQNLGSEVMRQIIPDVRARTAVLTLAANYGTLEGVLLQMNQAAGATDAAFKKMIDTIENKFKLLKSSIIAAIIKNEAFAQSLDDLASNADGSATAVGNLVANLTSVAGWFLTGTAKMAAYIETDMKLRVATEELAFAQEVLKEKLDGISEATGLNIENSDQLYELIRLGVVEYDNQTEALTANTLNLGLYKDGMLEAGEVGKDFVSLNSKIADELGLTANEYHKLADEAAAFASSFASTAQIVADELGLTLAEYEKLLEANKKFADSFKMSVDDMIIQLARMVNAGKTGTAEYIALMEQINEAQSELNTKLVQSHRETHEVILIDLKIALEKGLLTEKAYNKKRAEEEKRHWDEIVKIRKAKLKEALAEAGKQSDKYKNALKELREAELKAAHAANDLAEATGETTKKQAAAKRASDNLTGALKKTGKAASDTGEKLKEAGDKGEEGAKTGEEAWQWFADQIGVTLEQLKAAIAEIMGEISAANQELDAYDRWKQQGQRVEIHPTAGSIVRGLEGADPFAIQQAIDAQQAFLSNPSDWATGTDSIAKARWIIDQLKKMLAGTYTGDFTEATTGNTAATSKNTATATKNTDATTTSAGATANNTTAIQDLTWSSNQGTQVQQETLTTLKKLATGRVIFVGDYSQDYHPALLSSGGLIPGSGTMDTVPAMLTPGEFVIQRKIVQALGPDFFHNLNSGIDMAGITAMTKKIAGGISKLSPSRPQIMELKFNFGNQIATGTFERSQAELIIAELKKAQMVAL